MNQFQSMKRYINESRYLVCLQGIKTSVDCGTVNYRSEQDDLYEIEEKYGYSPEEIFSSTFLNNRQEEFYEYYHNEILANMGTPSKGLKALAALEKKGVLKTVITREIYSLAKRAGCHHVIELHGSVYKNICPQCRKHFSFKLMKDTRGIVKCPDCFRAVRPEVCLMGEQIDNALVTRAADEVSKADVLLIIGCNMKGLLPETFIKYFEGSKILLINDEPHYTDDMADIVIHGNISDVLPQIL
ncbi:MAG: SIR2 family NAD-dependent protein deacylase [Lachnospiraceae bacterium]